jgi:hypothetical protein
MSDKKIYQICCNSESDWDFVHEILTRDGTLEDNIPSRAVELVDYKEHSPTRSTYLLTDEEAELLKANPRVKFINIDYASYPEYRPPKEELHMVPYRYVANVKNYRNFSNPSIVPANPTSADLNRAGYQLLRMTQKENPWYGISTQTVIENQIPNTATGIDVDVIVGDDGCDFGHVEFQTNSGSGPSDLIGGNVLDSSGTCMLIDMVLEGPYYIDPAWFDASPGTRLTTRWDGTTVPVESVAKDWWGNSAQRSSSFSTIGTVTVPATYTRANCNGDNTNTPNEGDHGTCCGALTYGRTQGWAYNSNKFFINVYGTYGLGIEQYFDMVKIFHNNKPINATYGTRNPTLTSNSWGYRAVQGTSGGAYYFRQGTTGAGGVTFTGGAKPAFMAYLGSTGDGNRFKGEMLDNSLTEAGNELIQAGVIFVVAAGNSNQQQVGSDQPDYNNYWASGLNVPLSSATHDEFGLTCYNTTSRRGFPQQLGKYTSNGKVIYPAINIGALDDQNMADGKERKVNYSDMGDQIDVYAPADGTMAANRGYTTQYLRADTYPGSGVPEGFTAMCNAIATLNGTSSFDAAPNTGWRLVTTSDTTATLTSIPSDLKGSSGLSQLSISGGDNDDGYFGVNISGGGGFTITFANSTFGNVYISTNSLVTFTSGYIDLTFNESTPAMRKICISAADNSCQRCYGGFEGTSPNRRIRFRFEGTNNISGVVGSPNMVWELTLYENARNQFDVQIGENARYVTEASFYDAAFSGTSAACPVSAGFIATKLQSNRNWTWQNVRNYLQSIEVQDASKFYQGPTPSTATSSDWADLNSLMGGTRRVLYNYNPVTQTLTLGNVSFSGGITIS